MEQRVELERQIRTIYRGKGEQKGLFSKALGVKRVAAYCRVSTLMDTQALSLDTQMLVFRQRIMEHPGWKLVDVYADEGKTGTSVKTRKEFMRMIADCEAGKIDYIITKSISRFARNTLECLNYVRHLQSLGVQVLFEKENLDTAGSASEMVLTILASLAQEESHSISDNVKWGIRKKFEKGDTRWCRCYGFEKGEKDQLVINPQEAEVVREMFWRYERGANLQQVADALNNEDIPSPRGGKWTLYSVAQMLDNEKYKGDVLLQKYLCIDHLTHKCIRNDATEVKSYYITRHHDHIVSPEVFDRVQKIRAMRSTQKGRIPQYPYGEMGIKCPLCGRALVQRNTRGNFKNRIAVGCFAEGGCGQYALRKNLLNEALLSAYNEVDMETLRRRGAVRFCDMKRAYPQMEMVEFYWLDELVERIELVEHRGEKPWKTRSTVSCWDAVVHWRCGLSSVVPINLRSVGNEPAVVAAQYWANDHKQRIQNEKRDESI